GSSGLGLYGVVFLLAVTAPRLPKLSGRPGGHSVVAASGAGGAPSAGGAVWASATPGRPAASGAPDGSPPPPQAPTRARAKEASRFMRSTLSHRRPVQRSHSSAEEDGPSRSRTHVDANCESSSKVTTTSSPSCAGNGGVGGTAPSGSAVTM